MIPELRGKGEAFMNEKEYSVSEAVRLVGVESHVLRYWEEELQADIRRTSQGHRVYSEKNIETFRKVKELKETGLQLRAIRILLDKAEGDEAKAALAEQICEIGNWREPDTRTQEKKAGKNETEGRNAAEDWENTEAGSAAEAQRNTVSGSIMVTGNVMEVPTDIADGNRTENAGNTVQEKFESVESCDEAVDNSLPECGKAGEMADVPEIIRKGAAEQVCGVTFSNLSSQGSDNLQQFEKILKRLIGEVVEERNRKMEEELREIFREELERIYLPYSDMMAEAAVSAEPYPGKSTASRYPEKNGVISQLRRLLRGGR